MSNKFDELTKGLAQSVTRRQALRRFGAGVAWAVLAVLGFGNNQAQAKGGATCCRYECSSPFGGVYYDKICETAGGSCPPPPTANCALYSVKNVVNCHFCR